MIVVNDDIGSMATVEYVFKVLGATYGGSWDRSLGSAPIADVKTVWANALDGFTQSEASRKSISWALNNLPDRCPNAMEFRRLCQQAPAPVVPQLPPPPKADPERMKSEISKIKDAIGATPSQRVNGREWATRILSRLEYGEKISPAVVGMARRGLAN